MDTTTIRERVEELRAGGGVGPTEHTLADALQMALDMCDTWDSMGGLCEDYPIAAEGLRGAIWKALT